MSLQELQHTPRQELRLELSPFFFSLLFTNELFYFIILAAGTVLFNAGIHNVNTVEEAARALRPLAGDQAYLLFALGVIGTGFLAIPVLAGSLSYMMAETFGWNEGFDKKYYEAPGFYITMGRSLIIGQLIHFTKISPIQALYLYGRTLRSNRSGAYCADFATTKRSWGNIPTMDGPIFSVLQRFCS
jgi:Mn2+/Fe2+ NRAMP family transporter